MSSLSSAAASSWFTRLGTAYRSGRSISRAALLLLASGTRLLAAGAHPLSHASSIEAIQFLVFSKANSAACIMTRGVWAGAAMLMLASLTQPFELPGVRISSCVSLRHTLSPRLRNPAAVTPACVVGRCVRMCAAPEGEGKDDRSTPASTSRAEGAARLCFCGVLGNTGHLTIDCWQFWQPQVGNFRCQS